MKRTTGHNVDQSNITPHQTSLPHEQSNDSIRPVLSARSLGASLRHNAFLSSSRTPNATPITTTADQSNSSDFQRADQAIADSAIGDAPRPPIVLGKNSAASEPGTRLVATADTDTADLAQPLPHRLSPSAESGSNITQPDSPSVLEDSFASPLESGLQTSSTVSSQSNRTVRGTPATSEIPLRTPSYFPYVPSRTSSSRNAPLHEPWTGLSPISADPNAKGQTRTRDRFMSQGGTPMRSQLLRTDTEDTTRQKQEEYVTPDLYDMVLRLNSELSLESWWECLIDITGKQYRAHRLSLAVPVDATDIENVPWGQKASYNARGLHLALSSADPSSADSYKSDVSEPASQEREQDRARATTGRPLLETRHSYAGYEAPPGSLDDEGRRLEKPKRPTFSRWVTSATPISAANFAPQDDGYLNRARTPSVTSHQDSDINRRPTDMSSDAEPHSICHKTLYALNREEDPLVDTAGVNRVLERSSLVLLTREVRDGRPSARTRENSKHVFSSSRKTGYDNTPKDISLVYEDYEQQPTTPWSQSPAPSPALRLDPEENPFFSPGQVNEDSFESPSAVEPDYSQGFEAIGVDGTTTLVHLPLVHPSLSKALPTLHEDAATTPSSTTQAHGTSKATSERKAPIAVLSIMSDTVPYPRNLVDSLEQLGPHLATSFHTCYQNSMISSRLEHALERQSNIAQPGGFFMNDPEPFALGLGLDTLLQYDNDDGVSSTIGSMGSPSEANSARSAHSTAASPAVTPGQSTMSDSPSSYFDVRKRQSLDRTRSSGLLTQAQFTASTASRNATNDHRSALRSLDTPSMAKDDKTSKSRKESSRTPDSATPRKAEISASRQTSSYTDQTSNHRQFSTLHSRGADFKASFPSLPVSATRGSRRTRPTRSTNSPTSTVDDGPIGISDSLIRILIDTIPVQIFIADPGNCRIRWVNSKFLAYGGLSEHDAVSNVPWDIVHPDERQDTERAWMKAITTGQQLQHKARMRRFDGHYRYQYIRGAPLRTADQRIVHWVGAIADFHDQHVAETKASEQQETAKSEAKYRALANSSPQIVFAATPSRGVIFCNSQWPAFSGQTEEEARGVGFMEAVHPDDLVKCKLPTFDDENEQVSNVPISMPPEPRRTLSSNTASSHLSGSSTASGDTILGTTDYSSSHGQMHMPQRKLSELASTGILKASRDVTGKQSYSTEVRLRMASGEYRWHLCRLLLAEPLIQAESEEHETWYGTCTDINDHKELERTLKETMDAKSRFLSNMSHEIRTPLNGIMGMTSFLIDSVLTPEQEDNVNIIRASTEGLRDLINDILDLSKVEAGMIKLTPDWLQLRSVVEAVTDLQAATALEKGIEVNYLVEPDVPTTLKGDAFRLRQIFLNVIGNAIKFTQEGEVYVHCKRLPMLPEDYKDNSTVIQVDVQDTGSGFSEQEANMLFKRFSQIDGSSTRQHGGTGLGLVISMQLVELHGGHMTATSTVGKGSCFSCTFRFGLPTDDDHSPTTPVPEADGSRMHTTQHDKTKSRRRSDHKASDSRLEQVLVGREVLASPPTYMRSDRASPSSAGSEYSTRTHLTSRASSKSSQSSAGSIDPRASLHLEIVPEDRSHGVSTKFSSMAAKVATPPLLYSILVICPLQRTCDAIVGHLKSTLDKKAPHNITPRSDLQEASRLIVGEEAVNFTHVVINCKDTDAVMMLTKHVFDTRSSTTSIVIVCDIAQRKQILDRGSDLGHPAYIKSRRLQFVQRPVKPSRLAVIFDPFQGRESSNDNVQSTNQQFAAQQKLVLDRMTRRLGDRGLKFLLVEDNPVNQKVMLRLLQRIGVKVDTVADGQQAVDRVLQCQPGTFAVILMDLMMPRKDGYEACKEIRKWENDNDHSATPIIALSADVLDGVWRKCQEAGFNSYLTKPLDIPDLSAELMKLLDPDDPSKPLQFMKKKGGPGGKSHTK